MVTVAGHITVDPQQRESYLAASVSVVEKAHFERWESQAAGGTSRKHGPSNRQRAAMLSASVAEYDIADVRPSLGKGRA